MAYSDYGAFVYCNGVRRKDKEDTTIFETSHAIEMMYSWTACYHHGILGDGNVRVMCHKQGLPYLYGLRDDGEIYEIKYVEDDVDPYDYGTIIFDYKDYHFVFRSTKPYEAIMIEPDGTEWRCTYDYHHGAGFETLEEIRG